ncbi:hypothetical protein [Pseudoroseicyclus aestuarii]|uniref:Uncharacterized protein n=1 Tax=Pseudoroseicyclus aestuarii TaxID=1795041 RepID=A0A318STG6_9RHOB|nr:hypothetical protein [Pseudoroseicyclus aestuarii]PYE84655.1 hypothetical protein DFP88_102458 [Pseudoroseicyclus aestuarii]
MTGPQGQGLASFDWAAPELALLGAAVVWLIGGLLWLAVVTGFGAAALVAVLVPAGLLGLAGQGLHAQRLARQEAQTLSAQLEALRQDLRGLERASGKQPAAAPSAVETAALPAALERRLAEIAQQQRGTLEALAQISAARPEPAASPRAPSPEPAPAPAEGQQALAFEPDDLDQPALPVATQILALNFPDSAEDRAGIAALRRGLRDHALRQMIQASQDVLTLLGQDGLYMDDMAPDRARPEVWRQFARGERGRAVAALGGIRDKTVLAVTSTRMREDTIFRDAAHHFLRLFDRTLVRLEAEASDVELAALSDTRTARAFMLLGRVTGTFA